jgi:uncharacterized protein (DUF1501 family)
VGKPVNGGHYGEIPSLTNLADGDNLEHTTDFRRVYQAVIEGWLQNEDADRLLNGNFGTFDIFS